MYNAVNKGAGNVRRSVYMERRQPTTAIPVTRCNSGGNLMSGDLDAGPTTMNAGLLRTTATRQIHLQTNCNLKHHSNTTTTPAGIIGHVPNRQT